MYEMRELITLATLGICSYTDIKERSVDLIYVVLQSVIGIFLLGCEMWINPGAKTVRLLNYYLILPIAVGVFLIIVSKCTGGEIGEGDGYVLAGVGICLGMRELLCVVLYSLIICGVFSGMLLLTKRAKREMRIPLIPFILAGYFVKLVQVLP